MPVQKDTAWLVTNTSIADVVIRGISNSPTIHANQTVTITDYATKAFIAKNTNIITLLSNNYITLSLQLIDSFPQSIQLLTTPLAIEEVISFLPAGSGTSGTSGT